MREIIEKVITPLIIILMVIATILSAFYSLYLALWKQEYTGAIFFALLAVGLTKLVDALASP